MMPGATRELRSVNHILKRCVLCLMLLPLTAYARAPARALHDEPALKTIFIPLANNVNAVVMERVKPDPIKSRIAILVTHPGRVNNFQYFLGPALASYGYRVMLLNDYGTENSFYDLIRPIAAAINALRAMPGVEKVVLAGHSAGGPEVTSYEDVAENGARVCQGAYRIYKCDGKGLNDLPRADGLMLLDSAAGAPERTDALDPSIDPDHPGERNPALDMYDPRNGYDPATHGAHYSATFLKRYYGAVAARSALLIGEAQARLRRIESGKGEFKDDDPLIVPGSTLQINGSRPQLADTRLLSHSRYPHLLLEADGNQAVQIIHQDFAPEANPAVLDRLYVTTLDTTVRHYLSFQGLRVMPDYHLTDDDVVGVQWRSTPNSIQGNVQGIRIPTLVMSGSCAPHVVYLEIAYEKSAAKDKQFVAVQGANHVFRPCRPQYGDTFKRAFDYVDGWLSKPGRFLQ
jgi:pimeloyl-ACP methyl ester carboxylesterase